MGRNVGATSSNPWIVYFVYEWKLRSMEAREKVICKTIYIGALRWIPLFNE